MILTRQWRPSIMDFTHGRVILRPFLGWLTWAKLGRTQRWTYGELPGAGSRERPCCWWVQKRDFWNKEYWAKCATQTSSQEQSLFLDTQPAIAWGGPWQTYQLKDFRVPRAEGDCGRKHFDSGGAWSSRVGSCVGNQGPGQWFVWPMDKTW